MAAGYLAFSSVTESGNIWALPVDHSRGKALGEIQALTQDTSINGLPSISADGTRLVYTSRRSGSRTGLIKELNSGRVRALPTRIAGEVRLVPPKSIQGRVNGCLRCVLHRINRQTFRSQYR